MRTPSLPAGRAPCARDLQNQIASYAFRPVQYQHHPDDLIGMDEIFAKVNHTAKWGYANNIIPIYNKRGKQLNNRKMTPFPFEQLPPPVVKVGKKSWQRASIDAWLRRVVERAGVVPWPHDDERNFDVEVE